MSSNREDKAPNRKAPTRVASTRVGTMGITDTPSVAPSTVPQNPWERHVSNAVQIREENRYQAAVDQLEAKVVTEWKLRTGQNHVTPGTITRRHLTSDKMLSKALVSVGDDDEDDVVFIMDDGEECEMENNKDSKGGDTEKQRSHRDDGQGESEREKGRGA
ncbi:hypothetical protein OQA88_12250 [Cercophora sp. LCS_1]